MRMRERRQVTCVTARVAIHAGSRFSVESAQVLLCTLCAATAHDRVPITETTGILPDELS